jgi:hypothetical protein
MCSNLANGMLEEMFEDFKGITRSHTSKKDITIAE